jgi:hypothetical protein
MKFMLPHSSICCRRLKKCMVLMSAPMAVFSLSGGLTRRSRLTTRRVCGIPRNLTSCQRNRVSHRNGRYRSRCCRGRIRGKDRQILSRFEPEFCLFAGASYGRGSDGPGHRTLEARGLYNRLFFNTVWTRDRHVIADYVITLLPAEVVMFCGCGQINPTRRSRAHAAVESAVP